MKSLWEKWFENEQIKLMKIVASGFDDLRYIASCHRSAFPSSYASKLGKRFCVRMFRWYLETNNGILFHSVDEKGICTGYCGAIINDGKLDSGSSSTIMQYCFTHGIAALCLKPWLFFDPDVISNYKLIQRNILVKVGFKKNERTIASKAKLKANPHIGLVAIGVRSRMQGKGIGSLLLKELDKKTTNLGIGKMKLTVEETNTAALKVYITNGWDIVSSASGKVLMSKDL